MTFTRGLFCVIVALSIALLPLDARVNSGLDNLSIQKSEAHAVPVAIPAAGAAISALAIELGISESALIAGICAVGVGATGLAFYNASRTDVALPGFKPWDDLTPSEKQGWVGQSGNSDDYFKQQVTWWGIAEGWWDFNDVTGEPEPTPEPDPEQDPDGHEKWQKARNILIALAAGGGAVAFNEAVGPMIDNVAGSIHDLLFGSSGNSSIGDLGLTYQSSTSIDGLPVVFATAPSITVTLPGTLGTQTLTSGQWAIRGNSGIMSSENVIIASRIGTSYQTPTVNLIKSGSPTRWTANSTGNPTKEWDFIQYNVARQEYYVAKSDSWISGRLPNTQDNDTRVNYLNAVYSGTYHFEDGTTYANGKLVGNTVITADYGQMSDTPSGLVQNILNQNDYNTWVNNYTTDAPQDYKRALTIPANFNDPDYEPSYDDFVKVTPEQDITPIPDNEPINPDTPTPTPDTQYQQDFGQEVGELLAQPFNQLFPFCLIGDLYALTQKIEDAIYPDDSLSTQDVVIINGTSELVVPLDDFGVQGMDDIELDLTPVLQFGNLVRPWTTAIFIVLLLVGTFRFFLNRGGE